MSHRVNGPNDDKGSSNGHKPSIVFLPIPNELKDKGVRAITYARTFISIDYNGKIHTFTVHKEDITKTHGVYDKELNHEVDELTKKEIWDKCISANWLKHVYTKDEIERDAIGGIDNAQILLDLAKKDCLQIFKDEFKVAHAAVTISDHVENLPISETRFKNWLRKTVRKKHDVILRSQLIDEVANTLIADAEFDGQIIDLGLRTAVAKDDDLTWYYDLTNESYELIEITAENWKTSKKAIIFRRFDHQKPQDYPASSEDYPPNIFDQFMDLLNVKEQSRLILKCYIISLFIPNLPRAVLMVHGEQGTAKSMLEELIKMLVDPSLIKTLSFPNDTAELIQQLSHHYLTYYDNLSHIPEWISDLLCRAVTGAGFSKRRLYTNNQDVVYSIMRAIGFNGINLAATKPDLLDRGLIIQTDTIPRSNRRKIKEIWSKFYTIRPQLLAYILDTLVKVLRWKKGNQNLEVITEFPRMADWAEWCEIISRCMGEKDDAFINAYNENIILQTEEVIEGSDLAIAIRELAFREQKWSGTPTELLTWLNIIADANNIDRRNKYWPKTAARLSRSLKILLRTLREIGIEVVWHKDTSTKNSTRIITIRIISSEASERQKNENYTQKDCQSSDDTTQEERTVSSEEKAEKHTQNHASDDMTVSDDILENSDEEQEK